MTRCLVVADARPNFMKLTPVLTELERRSEQAILVHTGQHHDPAMSDVELGTPVPDHHLEVGSASHAVQTARTIEAFEPVVLDDEPDIAVVAGDVNSTVAYALVASKLSVEPDEYVLLTPHRPSNVNDPKTLEALLGAIAQIAERIPVLYPFHPRVRSELIDLDVSPDIRLSELAGYLDFVALQAGERLVLTDSGGLQEETILGIPCLTLRESTQRPITIDEGTNQLAGTDPERIVDLAAEILDGRGIPDRRPDLRDGEAAVCIADALGV